MNALIAALQILALSNEPLSKQEIARRAIESGIWVSTGKTPYETIGSQIYTDIKKKGDRSEFVLVEPGVFTLRQLTQQTQRPKTDTPAQPQADKAQDPGTTTTNNKKTQPQTTQAKPQTAQTQPQAKPQHDAEPSPQPARSRLAAPIRDDLQTIAEPQSFADCAYAILDSFACQKPMTFPAILSSTASILSGAAALIVAILLAYRGKSLIVVAVSSSAAVLLVECILKLMGVLA